MRVGTRTACRWHGSITFTPTEKEVFKSKVFEKYVVCYIKKSAGAFKRLELSKLTLFLPFLLVIHIFCSTHLSLRF